MWNIHLFSILFFLVGALSSIQSLHAQTSSFKAYSSSGAVAAPSKSTVRKPHLDARVFDPEYYLSVNPDVAAAGPTDALGRIAFATLHWESHGIAEGRASHPTFSSRHYQAPYCDLVKAFGNNRAALIDHFLNVGFAEGRSQFLSRKVYDPDIDALLNPDLVPNLTKAFKPASMADLVKLLD